jgi:uncharacterized protein (TIGR02265 family)
VSDEKLIFRQVVEACFVVGLADRLTPAYRAHLKTFGIDLEKLLPGYPYANWEKAVQSTVRLFPELDADQAVAEVGRRMCVATVESNPVGKRLLPLLRVLGVGKALRRAYSRTTEGNFNTITFGVETPKSLEIHMSFVGQIPEFARGSVVGLGEMLGVALRPVTTVFEAPRATFNVGWD